MKHTKILFALLLLFSMLMLSSCGIRTAKYDFELHGDVVLSPNKAGTYLNGRIECTVTCVSGRDYYEGGNPVDPARAWLIMPDGTKYSAANPAPPEGALVDVKAGDTIKTTLSFSHLPLDFAPGEYDILVSEYDDSTGEGDYSKKLFEKVTVRFGEEAPAETTPAVQLPPLSESLASEADVKGVGVEMDGVIVEAKRYSWISYQCCAYDEATGEYYYSSEGENGMLVLYDSQRLVDEGCPVVKYSQNYQLINNINTPGASGPSLYAVYDAELNNNVGHSVPSAPGLYWMIFTVTYDNHPRDNKDIIPVLNEWYVIDEQYWVGVIFE